MKTFLFLLLITIIIFCIPAWPHGSAGRRIFPATIAILDPAVNDELNLSVFRTQSPAEKGGSIWKTNPRMAYAKRITPHFQLSLIGSYLHTHPPGTRPKNGFEDWIVGAKYEAYVNPHCETIFSLGVEFALGGTGSHLVDAVPNTTVSPQILFGQGFGALPNSVKYLKPFVMTGILQPNINTANGRVTSVSYGIVIEYSLSYLDAFINNHRQQANLNDIVPLIEFPMNTCTQGKCSRQTIGTINPGVLIVRKYMQLGLEALVPINSHTGSKVGGVVQVHFYLDDIFPNSIGKPLFT